HAVVADGVRTRRTRWRHRLRPQFTNHLLPSVSACADVVDTSGIDDQAAALQPFVMTSGAVLLEDSGRRGGGGDSRRGWRLWHGPRRGNGDRKAERGDAEQPSVAHSNTGLYYPRREDEVSRLASPRHHRVPGRHDLCACSRVTID